MSASAATATSPVKDAEKPKETENGTTASPEKPTEEAKPSPTKAEDKESVSKALNLLASGKRNLLVGDVPAAVAALADACESFVSVYGESGVECGEAYFFYGKALLELARMETGVIENVMDGVPLDEGSSTEDDEGDEKKKDDSVVGDPAKVTSEELEEIETKVAEAIVENQKACDAIEKKLKHKEASEKIVKELKEQKAAHEEIEKKLQDVKESEETKKERDELKDKLEKSAKILEEIEAEKKKLDELKVEVSKLKEEMDKEAKSPAKKSPAKEGNKSPDKEAKSPKKSPKKEEDEEKMEVSPTKDTKESPSKDKTSPPKVKNEEEAKESPKRSPSKDAKAKSPAKEDSKTEKKDSSENSEEEEEDANKAEEDKPEGDSEKVDDEEAKDGEEEADGDEEEEEKGDNESIASNDEGTSNAKETNDQGALAAEDEEDPSNLQLSWEMLELAKNCFQRHADSLPAEDNKRMELEDRLSEAFQILGEISIESESYEQAIEDLNSCLRRRQELMPEDSRLIAETHYQMGVAYGFGLKFDEAVASLNDAIAVLSKRIENLKNKTEGVDPLKKNDAFYSREKEITEIESLLPEIHEKIADTKDMAKESVKRIGDRVLMGEGELETSSSGDGPKVAKAIPIKGKSSNGTSNGTKNGGEASDITHMLKKRKPSDEPSAENGSSETKKPHLEESSAAETNGVKSQ